MSAQVLHSSTVLVPQSISTTPPDKLPTLVENRKAFTLESCELNVFETHQSTSAVPLLFPDLVLTSMLRGKKVMHLPEKPSFDYVPGQSVLVAPGEKMIIDFPEASIYAPTQCIALAISGQSIRHTLDYLNEKQRKAEDGDTWLLHPSYYHLVNTQELTGVLNRIIHLSISPGADKDIFVDLALKELIIRLLQAQARTMLEQQSLQLSSRHRFAFVLQYIQENFTGRINVDLLAEKACMSRAVFYRAFRREFGTSPLEYITAKRLELAHQLLSAPGAMVSDVCYRAGFNNLNYFIGLYKRHFGFTPGHRKG
jgi:AraC-like DNA-binding protein